METVEIPRPQWPEFFEDFSREHEGQIATLEVVGRDLGAQIEADAMPLIGLSAEPSDDVVWVALARDADEHLTHGVHGVTHVRVERSGKDAADVVQLESRDGMMTLLRVRAG